MMMEHSKFLICVKQLTTAFLNKTKRRNQMSHITKYKERVTDLQTFMQVAPLHGEFKMTETVQMFGSQAVNAACQVKLPGWRYAVAIGKDGSIYYDHFGSQPNTMEKLGVMLQDYNEQATAKVVPYDRVNNHYTEMKENGDRKLVLEYA
jgi:hypothetical protein